MSNNQQVMQYVIKITPEGSQGWQNIVDLPYEICQTLNEIIKENYPIGPPELEKILAILEEYAQGTKDYIYGLTIAEQTETEGRLIIMQIDSQQFKKEVNKSPKEILWSNVMATGLASKNEKKFDHLIRHHLDRVEFVRDGVGLRDFLFLSQEGVGNEEAGFMENVYGVFDSEVEPAMDYETQHQMHMKERINKETEVLKKLIHFFKHTNRTLYVGVGFEENLEIDPMLLLSRAVTGRRSLYEEAKTRPFPVWYKNNAKMPEEAVFMSKKAEKFVKEYLEEEEMEILKEKLQKINRHDLIKLIEKV